MTRVKEIFKNIVIAVLVLTGLFLLLLAMPASIVAELPLPDRLAAFLDADTPQVAAPAATDKLTPAATPLTVSIRHDGGRHTIRRDAAALDAAYDSLSVYLGRALASAHDGKAVTWEDVISALEEPGVLFSFPGTVPAQALCLWLTGGHTGLSDTAEDYLLIRRGSSIRLITCTQSPMEYETTVSAPGLVAVLETYTPDGTAYAAQRDTHLHPLTLWEQSVTLPAYAAENPVDGVFAEALATALEFNPYGPGTYTDPDGNTVFTEPSRTLSVSADGTISLAVTENDSALFTAGTDTPAAKVETVRALLDILTQGSVGDAKLQLSGYDETSCEFTYLLNGVRVAPAACRAVFDGVSLTEITLTLRSYHLSADQNRLMPLASAAALAGENARLIPAYTLAAAPGWTQE